MCLTRLLGFASQIAEASSLAVAGALKTDPTASSTSTTVSSRSSASTKLAQGQPSSAPNSSASNYSNQEQQGHTSARYHHHYHRDEDVETSISSQPSPLDSAIDDPEATSFSILSSNDAELLRAVQVQGITSVDRGSSSRSFLVASSLRIAGSLPPSNQGRTQDSALYGDTFALELQNSVWAKFAPSRKKPEAAGNLTEAEPWSPRSKKAFLTNSADLMKEHPLNMHFRSERNLQSVQTPNMATCKSEISPAPGPKEDSRVSIAVLRDLQGQCPSCGLQLYKIQPIQEKAIGLGVLRKKDTTALPTATTPAMTVRRIPLTIPDQVIRGQCIPCQKLGAGVGCHGPTEDNPCPSMTPTVGVAESLSDSNKNKNKNISQKDEDERDSGVVLVRGTVDDDDDEDSDGLLYYTTDDEYPIAAPTGRGSGGLNASHSSYTNSNDLEGDLETTLAGAAVGIAIDPTHVAVYTGTYNEYGERHGTGEMVWNNGDVYKGEFFNGVRHGHGTLIFATGGEYVGEWECNRMHGSGTRRYADGNVFMGCFVDNVRTGEGRFYYANGDLYHGEWVEGTMSGTGRYYYSSGQRFEGTFKDGKRHGKGKLQRTDGTLEIFRYVQDQRVSSGVRWSPDRTKAWKLDTRKGKITRKHKISIPEAVSIDYALDYDCFVSE